MNLLYIDPGTGSMLFTIIVGLVTTLYVLGRTAAMRLRTFFAGRGPRADTDRAGLVIYSEGKRYWNVFEPIVEELERRRIPALFLSSERDDLIFEGRYDFVRSGYIGKGYAAYARLNALEADTCLMTTPGLDVYQLKRAKRVRRYVHILHAVDDATSYRLFGLDYFDAVLLTGSHQSDAIRELEAKRGLPAKDLAVVGCTYLDVYARKAETMAAGQRDAPTVLVSPSWGDGGLLRKYGLSLLLPLAQTGMNVIVRPHPQSLVSEAETVAKLKDGLAAYPNVEWDEKRENLDALARADIMISDFSGVIFDYAFLFGKPVLYTLSEFDPRPYDASDVAGEPWKFRAIRELGRELDPADFPAIGEAVRSVRADPGLAARIAALREQAWHHRGRSGEKTVDWLMEDGFLRQTGQGAASNRAGDPPLRVLHLVTNAELGGAQRVVAELANRAVAAGHGCGVAAMKDGPMWDTLDPRISRFPLRHARKSIDPARDALTLLEIWRLAREYKPDVLHLHSSKMGALGRLAAGRLKGRTVYTIHGFDTILKAHRAFLPLERLLARACGAIVPVSAYDEANLASAGVGGRKRLIRNGISDRLGRMPPDGPAAKAMQAARDGGNAVVLCTARLAAPKRFDLFLAAAAALSDRPCSFFWIGNAATRDSLERETPGGVPPNLTLLGELPEAGDYANLCDVFVLLSDYEGLPMSILEAMSCGKPVLASAVGGIAEAVDGRNGLLVPNDALRVTEGLARLLGDTALMDRMGREARRRSTGEFSAEAMWTAYEGLYKELVR